MVSSNLVAALKLIDAAHQEYSMSLFVQAGLGTPLAAIPQISLEEAGRRAELGSDLLRGIGEVDREALPPRIATAVGVAERLAATWAREADWYWLVFDPRALGYFAMFTAAAYGGGSLINSVHNALADYPLKATGDLDRYLGLVSDYARLIRQMHDRTLGQLERGIAMPVSQVIQAEVLLKGLRDQAATILKVAPARYGALDPAGFGPELERRIDALVLPAYDAFLIDMTGRFREAAPVAVGLGQYPGGDEVYRALVGLHTTVDLSPQEVHRLGLERIARIRDDMASVLAEADFDGTPADYAIHLSKDCAWRAETESEIAALFGRYIDRLEPVVSDFFYRTPSTTHCVRPLAKALEETMTFGFYRRPTPGDPEGVYFFNARNLSKQPLMNIAALTYHELEPGHHMQMAGLQEDEGVHPLIAHSFINAYAEGWAEYGAALAGEMGMYREPAEKFGKLVMDSFLSCRLVVDTGMNALGWSLEQARDYMRSNAFISEAEILTETIRYSCDIPAQSLAYKLGDVKIMEMRTTMAERLGARFDIRDFHAVVLGEGALPLSMVEANVRRRTEELLEAAA
jgi:uncharacterized protein (DUF885 family)